MYFSLCVQKSLVQLLATFVLSGRLCSSEYYQHSAIDSDVCDLYKILSPASKIQCVLRCQRKKQAAVYKEKQCYCTNTECLQKGSRRIPENTNDEAAIFTKVTEYPKFLLDFPTMTTNNPVLPDKLFQITNAISMTVWLNRHPRILASNTNNIFTMPLNQILQNSDIQAFAYIANGPYFVFKGVQYSSGLKLPLEKWTHISVTVQQSGDTMLFKTYINGKLMTEETIVTGGAEHELPVGEAYKGIVLGNDIDGDVNDDPDNFLNGRVTELYLFNSVLGEHDVKESYNQRVPQENRILSWHEFKGTANEVDVRTVKYTDEISN